MRTYVFLDLDDTVFQTLPKCPAGEPLRPVARRTDGSPISFMTRRQQTLFDRLRREAEIVPVTARNLAAFRRVDLPFACGAILDYGAVVLFPDGTLDAAWDAAVRPRAEALTGELQGVQQALREFIVQRGLEVTTRLVEDFGMTLYLVAKQPRRLTSELRTVRDELLPTLDLRRFFVHYNDNNLALIPRCFGKERAVRHVLDNHLGEEPRLTIGLADSLTDAPFLALCDYSLVPHGSQLFLQTLAVL